MVNSTVIKEAIRELDSYIDELKVLRQRLVIIGGPDVHIGKHLSRKDTVLSLLKEKGPMRYRDIRSETGLPKGTLCSVLNDRSLFVLEQGRKWNFVRPLGEMSK